MDIDKLSDISTSWQGQVHPMRFDEIAGSLSILWIFQTCSTLYSVRSTPPLYSFIPSEAHLQHVNAMRARPSTLLTMIQ